MISVTLAIFFAIVGAGVVGGMRVYQKVKSAPNAQNSAPDVEDESEDDPPSSEYAVEHGNVVRPEDLHGHGKLYFVPVGRQVISVESLADYYRQKFQIDITVLPKVEAGTSSCMPARRQCGAEELEADMTSAYPEIARNLNSVMIALTDEDIFPSDRGWKFTYSWHEARIGIVSTRRMDPAFWGNPPNEAVRLAGTKQMLTKYIAMQYFHLPDSLDPTSILYTPLTPDGGPDDIYESDLHPEQSVNGRRGKSFPCLYVAYSYKTHKVRPDQPALSDCFYENPVATEDDETFTINLGWGNLTQRSLDLHLDSAPEIEFKRGYNSWAGLPNVGLGWGANHSYNAWLSSDGLSNLTYTDINHEDSTADRLPRTDKGRGFNANVAYESREAWMYGARLTWRAGIYTLRYRDGASSRFLECDSPTIHCYWIGYQDAKGNAVRFDRAPTQELLQLTASDSQGIAFQYDDEHRIVKAAATNGEQVFYKYDAAGCLARVRRPDGQIALYEYDSAHRLTRFSVVHKPAGTPEHILTNEYDPQGHLVKQTLAGVGTYKIEYSGLPGKPTSALKIVDPTGNTVEVTVGDAEYLVRDATIRFQKVAR